METTAIGDIQTVLPYFLKHKTVWAFYDNEADVLYVHFKKPNITDNSEMTEDEIIVHYKNKEVVGLTILNVSRHVETSSR